MLFHRCCHDVRDCKGNTFLCILLYKSGKKSSFFLIQALRIASAGKIFLNVFLSLLLVAA